MGYPVKPGFDHEPGRGRRCRQSGESNIQILSLQARDQIGAEITDDFKVKLINILADLGQSPPRNSQSVIIRHADPHLLDVGAAAGLGDQFVISTEQRKCLGIELAAKRRGLKTVVLALEKLAAQLLFQHLEPHAHGGLGAAQLVGRPRNGSPLIDGRKAAQQFEFYIHLSSITIRYADHQPN